MTLEWCSLPLLPLRCILDHLSTEDALAAMSTCRHWRNAMLLYEGRKETLKLKAKHLEKSLFLTRVFRKHTRKLHIYLDCTDPELEKFINFVLTQYFDTVKLQELVFIGSSYIHQNQHVPFVKLKRIVTEALVYKHMHCLQKLALMGCAINTMKNENDRYIHKHTEYYSRALKFNSVLTPADSLLSSANASLMRFSTLKHIVVDYEQINTASLETLSNISTLVHITLNITYKRPTLLQPVDWHHLQRVFTTPLQVAVNLIAVPYRKFNHIMENVLVEGLNLTSLKVLFCKSFYSPLVGHVSRLYQSSLLELVWVDSPYDSEDPYHRIVRPLRHAQQPEDYAHVNPFVLLCWQCVHLKRLVIHGYWVWQYDLLGFVRLRKSLSDLEISAIYVEQDKFYTALQLSEEGTVRVLVGDGPASVDTDYIQEVNEYTKFKWKPLQWNKLHPALRARSTASHRADYITHEARSTPA